MRPKSPYETVIETAPEGATAIAVATAEVRESDQLNTGVLVQTPPASVAWRSSVVDPLVPRYAAWIWSDQSMAMDAPLPAASIVVTDQPPAELVQYRIEAIAASPGTPVSGGNASSTTWRWSFVSRARTARKTEWSPSRTVVVQPPPALVAYSSEVSAMTTWIAPVESTATAV